MSLQTSVRKHNHQKVINLVIDLVGNQLHTDVYFKHNQVFNGINFIFDTH